MKSPNVVDRVLERLDDFARERSQGGIEFRRFDPDRHVRGRHAVERACEALQSPIAFGPDRFDDGLDLIGERAEIRLRPGQ